MNKAQKGGKYYGVLNMRSDYYGIPIKEHFDSSVIFSDEIILAPKIVIRNWQWSFGRLGFYHATKNHKVYILK